MSGEGPFRDDEIHVLAERCETCVFRPGNLMHLQPGRLKDLVTANLRNDSALTCHSTLYQDEVLPAICRGYFDLHKNDVLPLRLAQALDLIVEDPVPPKGVKE